MKAGQRACLTALAIVFAPTHAFAHASERGHVLLLPTGYYLAGGALAVAASFLILAFVRPSQLQVYAGFRLVICPAPMRGRGLVSWLAFALFGLLIAAGFLGSPDPLHNPLPTFFWTLFWVGLTLAHGVFGNLWSWLNPWQAPCRLLRGDHVGPLKLPGSLELWPAVVLLVGFAWFELIDLAPEDPRRLVVMLTGYWTLTFVGCLLFGYRDWMERCEFFSVFFGMVSKFSILDIEEPSKLALCFPGARLLSANPLPVSGVLFLLTALASVSFDGLSKTFAWFSLIGVNPLDFPGRSAVVGANTIGLVAVVAALSAAFIICVWLGERLVDASGLRAASALLIWSIVPISLAYHFSHYLTALMVDGQYALIALSDPFSRGWNLLGLTGRDVQAGVVMGHDAAWMIWNAQAAAIVGGHVLAVVVAHMLALRLYGAERNAMLSQIPLAALMVAYTLFGLWLLSTPSIG